MIGRKTRTDKFFHSAPNFDQSIQMPIKALLSFPFASQITTQTEATDFAISVYFSFHACVYTVEIKHDQLDTKYCLLPLCLHLLRPPPNLLFPQAGDLEADDPLIRPFQLFGSYCHRPDKGVGCLPEPGIFRTLGSTVHHPSTAPSQARLKLVSWWRGRGGRCGVHHLHVHCRAWGRDKRAPVQSSVPRSLLGQVD